MRTLWFDPDDTDFGKKALNRREFLIGAVSVAGGLTFAACDSSTSTGSSSASSGKKYTLAFVPGLLTDAPFYITAKDAAVAEAKALGQTLKVDAPAQFSATLQVPIIDTYIAQKVDAIITAPVDSQTLLGPLQRANSAGIKVITFDTYLGNGDYKKGPVTFPVSYIGSDNTQGGQLAGEALIKSIGGRGKIYLQSTAPGVSSEDQRIAGFKQAIDEANRRSGKEIVTLAGINYDGGSTAKATSQVQALLERDPNAAGFFGTNFFSCDGIVAALNNTKKASIVKVAYFDATPNGITNLRNGIVTLVVAQKPADMGKLAVDYAIKALNGEAGVQKHMGTGFVVITRDTVDNPQSQAAIYKTN